MKTQTGYLCSRVATKAFTLIELLVVILIILVLAALLYPGFKGVFKLADRTTCASNLHQIGLAMNLYLSDNQGILPGTFWAGNGGQQSYVYASVDGWPVGRVLARWLAPYLQTPTPYGGYSESKYFKCPGFMKQLPSAYWRADQQPYIANNGDDGSVVDQNGLRVFPFGNYSAGTPSSRLLTLAGYKTPLSQLWAIKDMDAGNVLGTKDALNFLPKTPVHGNCRNTLFFDWHVEPVKVP